MEMYLVSLFLACVLLLTTTEMVNAKPSFHPESLRQKIQLNEEMTTVNAPIKETDDQHTVAIIRTEKPSEQEITPTLSSLPLSRTSDHAIVKISSQAKRISKQILRRVKRRCFPGQNHCKTPAPSWQ